MKTGTDENSGGPDNLLSGSRSEEERQEAEVKIDPSKIDRFMRSAEVGIVRRSDPAIVKG